jgi:hypothetical protein
MGSIYVFGALQAMQYVITRINHDSCVVLIFDKIPLQNRVENGK